MAKVGLKGPKDIPIGSLWFCRDETVMYPVTVFNYTNLSKHMGVVDIAILVKFRNNYPKTPYRTADFLALFERVDENSARYGMYLLFCETVG